MVADTEAEVLGVPVRDRYGDIRVLEQRYPFFARVDPDRMGGGAMTAGLGPVIAHWPVALEVAAPEGVSAQVLLSSSAEAWLHDGADIEPTVSRLQTGFPRPAAVAAGDVGPHALAVALTGTFPSAVADAAKPATPGASGDGAATPEASSGDQGAAPILTRSTPDARLVVVGSSSMFADAMLAIADRMGAREVENNLVFAQNLVDWSVEDTELLAIRARGAGTRLLTIEADHQSRWEWINIGVAFVGLVSVLGASQVSRRQQGGFELPPRRPAREEEV
jgi:hypothetical protein